MLSNPDIIILLLSFILILGIFICFIVLFLFRFKQRQAEYHQEKKELQAVFQQELLKSQLEIQEQTLKNVSQEIHDNIGQVLSLVKLNIHTMDINNINLLQDKINDSKLLIGKAIYDLRDLSRSINTDYVKDMGLLPCIDYELSLIKKTIPCHTEIKTDGALYRLEPQKELILFRIFQEAVNNIIKHAQCNCISVLLSFSPGLFTMQVNDNGKGISENATLNGIGIRNMRNRANIIGGSLHLTSNSGGTEVKVMLPV